MKICKMISSQNFCRRVCVQIANVVQKNSNRGLKTGATPLSLSKVRQKRNELFEKEKARQRALITRIEKIKVDHKGVPEECTLLMNKGLSTPFNCAMHINELLMTRSVLALVNDEPWDMHRPLTEDCELKFLHFKDENPELANETFWRSCSFMMGYVLETAFKDEYFVELCSFPKPNIRSGSFVYDADLKLPDWKPSSSELRCLGYNAVRSTFEDMKFERLEVDASVALQMFEDNRFKVQQIPAMAAKSHSGSRVTLYRMGDHVDISQGPLMSSTQLLMRFKVCALHKIESPDFGPLTRIQGLAAPHQLSLHYWTFDKLAERAAILNKAPVPRLYKSSEGQRVIEENS